VPHCKQSKTAKHCNTFGAHCITNEMEYYSVYMPKIYIIKGVGGKQTHAEGHGDIILHMRHKDRITDLKLKDILYVPQNKYNLFALSKWDFNGRIYQGHDNKLTLFNKDHKVIVISLKIDQNLYKFAFEVIKCDPDSYTAYVLTNQITQSWEVWHKCFGHISYKSLYGLHNRQLCEGFDVNTTSNKPDCLACIQEKQTIYDITSIRGNQYFLLLIDDATRYVTLKFLKAKSDATCEVQAYLTHLQIRTHMPYVIKVDHSTEFLNQTLQTLCNKNGVDIVAL
jgi:gag-pre-integrase-like protein/Pol polyprotein